MHVTDTVFEYRSYPLAMPWGLVLTALVPWQALVPLLVLWAIQSYHRAGFYRSEFRWWEQAWRESPGKTRTRLRYSEQLMTAIHERYIAGEPWDSPELQAMIATATKIQDDFVGTRESCV